MISAYAHIRNGAEATVEKVGRPQIREVFMRNGARIEPGRDDLPDWVYESVFELLDSVIQQAGPVIQYAAPAVQGEPVAWLRFRSRRVAADDVIEGLEICEPGETGDDGEPAFPVYATPQPAEQQASTHWSHGYPGLADQYRSEALAARRSVGFEQDADDVAPTDIVAAIESLTQPAPDAALVEAFNAGRRAAQEELRSLREWIKETADQYDICTRQVLGKICDGCRCRYRKQGGEQ